jgi:hypothetical protein
LNALKIDSRLLKYGLFSSEDLTRLILLFKGVTVKIQQVAVHGNYENPTNDAKGEDE